MTFIKKFSDKLKELSDIISGADAIVLGAGAGLSTSAGFTYSGKRFADNFADFEEKYGFHDMYSGGFYPFESPEEKWAFWARNIFVNRYTDAPVPVYAILYRLVKDKNYFVLTTNVDHCFQKAGFDKKRLFYMQGDYGLFQCSVPCHRKTYDNEQLVRRMLKEQEGMKIPSELIPRCPVCGKPMSMNLRVDDTFVEDEGWHAAKRRYNRFLYENDGKKVLFLELGVGMNTPGIIKFPFLQMTYRNQNAYYVSINTEEFYLHDELAGRAYTFCDDIYTVLSELDRMKCH